MLDENTIRNIPKVELHRHMEGSIRPETAWETIQRNNLKVEANSLESFIQNAYMPTPAGNLGRVLGAMALTRRILLDSETIERVAFENVEDAWLDGVRLLELRFAPSLLTKTSGLDFAEVIRAVRAGVIGAMSAYPIEVGLIISLRRGSPMHENENLAETAIAMAKDLEKDPDFGSRIVGFDLSDDENLADPHSFAHLAMQVRNAGMGVTVHTGLNTSAGHIRNTMEHLRPDRIGHGILIMDDPSLVEEFLKLGTMIEISLTSNWITGAVLSLEKHPFPVMAKAGLSVCINTDDPQFFRIDLVDEYLKASLLYGLDTKAFSDMNIAALNHSFLPQSVRERARKTFFQTDADQLVPDKFWARRQT
jgi:adenosine deaminase